MTDLSPPDDDRPLTEGHDPLAPAPVPTPPSGGIAEPPADERGADLRDDLGEDLGDDDEDDLDELALLGESTAPPPWVGMVTGCGLAVAVITALDLIGSIAQGIAIETDQLNLFYRIGLDFANGLNDGGLGGLGLILALVLVCIPTFAGRATSDSHDRAAALAIGIVTAFAVVQLVGTLLGVAAQLEVLDLQGQDVTTRVQRRLATDVVRHAGLAAVALLTGLSALRVRFAPPAAVGLDDTE